MPRWDTAFPVPGRVRETTAEYGSREETNRARTAYEAYCDAHPEGFYITDVYSTVDFSEKMFVPGGGEELMPSNRDLAGGWLAFSPLQKKKKTRMSRCSFAKRN